MFSKRKVCTHDIHFYNKIKKFPYFCFLELSEEFPRDSKISSNQPWLNVIGVRAIQVQLYKQIDYQTEKAQTWEYLLFFSLQEITYL